MAEPRDLHIIMPMAGLGSRFASTGVKTPKPIIMVDGQVMFLKALSSLDDIDVPKQYSFIVRKQHTQDYPLVDQLKQLLPGCNIVVTDQQPTGAAVDALKAKHHLQAGEGVIILDCDLWFNSPEYSRLVTSALKNEQPTDGVLLTFASDNPRYSYAEVDEQGLVKRTQEKQVISAHAITGAYFFNQAQEFVAAAEELIAQPLSPQMPEYFVSLVYNVMLRKGATIRAAKTDQFASFGTPEELAAYEAKA